MERVHGFELHRLQQIGELKTTARLWVHQNTGAQLLSLSNDDENKVFGVTFRTPPKDSTGVAHILEHSVLCGSKKYPVKEPFVELLKGSLKTFLNAFTYPDKTCYPVASQNLKDFYNLIDVYLDAVFHPRITPPIFAQEGWHFEVERPEDPLIYKGVVYNEMKGAYSSPDRLLLEYAQQSLFPDNTYGFESGGEPRHIPRLTYEAFVDFHRRYYHPSNGRFYFYGDDDAMERLRLLDDFLRGFDRQEPASAIALQPPRPGPQRLVRSFVVGEEEQKAMMAVSWLLPQPFSGEFSLALHILEHILLAMSASPLRRALIESGLGEDLAGAGLEAELRQMYFSTGLKGIASDKVDAVESLILDTLKGLVKDGLDPQTVEAAINTVEFSLRENNTGSFPRGLALMLRALTTWLYDRDPLEPLTFEIPLASIKERVASGERLFEDLIDAYLMRNDHRRTLVLQPDSALRGRLEEEERRELEEARARMSPSDLKEAIETTLRLREMQQAPDPPEALATIPTLKLEDLERKHRVLPLELGEEAGMPLLFHDLFTNGIVYVDLGMNLQVLPQRYLPFVNLLGRAFLEMGTTEESYVRLSQRIGRATGGIDTETFTAATQLADRASTSWLFLRGKAIVSKAEEMMSIINDVLLRGRLDDQERFRQIVLEEKAGMEHSLVPQGHQMVGLRLRSHLNRAHWAAEQMEGISYLFFLRRLVRDIEEDWPGVQRSLEEMRRLLVNRQSMVINVTLDREAWMGLRPRWRPQLEAWPLAEVAWQEWQEQVAPANEGLVVPSQVNYVGKGGNLYDWGYQFHGSALVITAYLRTGWLWDQVRVQGGAYGAFSSFDRLSGSFVFLSYRDPNLKRTLETFDQAAQFLARAEMGHEELAKSIIGTIGELDRYLLPDAKGYVSMVRHLTGSSDEVLQRMRDQVLSTTREDFRSFGEVLGSIRERGLVKVLGPQESLEEAGLSLSRVL